MLLSNLFMHYKAKPSIFKFLLPLFFVLLATFAATAPLFHEGLYTAHDIWHQVARLFHFTQAIRDGQFPPSWISALSLGRGYPLFYFSYHLPWLIGAPLVIMGLNEIITIKILFFISVLASGLSMYLTADQIYKHRLAAVISAIVYIWAPYHFLTLFVSASMGTAFQFALAPLLFLSIYWIGHHKPRAGIFLLAVSGALSILSHLLTFVYLLPFLIIFAVFQLTQSKSYRHGLNKFALIVAGGLIALLLSAYYLLPLYSFSSLIKAQEQGNGFSQLFMSNFVSFKQLLYSPWGFGPIVSNAKDGEISFQVGIVQWLAVIVTVVIGVLSWICQRIWKRGLPFSNPLNSTLLGFVLVFTTSILAMLSASEPVWRFLSRFIAADYPFRLLLVAVLAGSLLIGQLIAAVKPPWMVGLLCVGLLVTTWYTNRNHVRVNMYTNIPVADYVDAETTTNTFHEYLPLKADSSLFKDGYAKGIDYPNSVTVLSKDQATQSTIITINATSSGKVTLSDFGFRGQAVYVNGQTQNYEFDGSGRIVVNLPAGTHTIVRQYEQTDVQQLGIILSCIGMLAVFRIVRNQKDKK